MKDRKEIIIYNQPYARIFDNWDKMGQFLKKKQIPKLTQEEIDNLNIYITIK